MAMLLTEREVREVAGDSVDTDGFPRPIQYGPEGRKWAEATVSVWLSQQKTKGRTKKRPKGDGDSVETRPVE